MCIRDRKKPGDNSDLNSDKGRPLTDPATETWPPLQPDNGMEHSLNFQPNYVMKIDVYKRQQRLLDGESQKKKFSLSGKKK